MLSMKISQKEEFLSEHRESRIARLPQLQSKTHIVKNKNKIFPIFLSPFLTESYACQASKYDRFFGSKVSTHLIIEALFLEFTLSLSKLVLD